MGYKPPNPISEDIPGAPFKIGQKIIVVSGSDNTFDRAFLGKIGQVTYYEYECGSGQIYPHDPMIGVEFSSGEIEEFWMEELSNA